jgi:hypothetical protein
MLKLQNITLYFTATPIVAGEEEEYHFYTFKLPAGQVCRAQVWCGRGHAGNGKPPLAVNIGI